MALIDYALPAGILASLAVALILLRRITGGRSPVLLVIFAMVAATQVAAQIEPTLGTIREAGQRIFQRL